MYANVWEYIHVGECISMYVSVCVCFCVNTCTCLSTCDSGYVWLCVPICESVLGCVCVWGVWVWVCECLSVRICMTVTYTWTFKLQTLKDANVHLVPARSQNPCRHIRCEWTLSLPSVSCCWRPFSSTVSHLLYLLYLLFLACSLDAGPCVPAIVLCFTFIGPVRLKMFS